MDAVTLTVFGLGLTLLVTGGECLVRSASRLAAAFGISPLVIGLTVVAYGTSAPELAVSVQSAFAGQADIALGNVVGSNIFNVLCILGLSALIGPLIVAQQLVRFDVPLMIGVSCVPLVMGLDGKIGRLDGFLLVAGIISYSVFAIRQSRRESEQVQREYVQEFGKERSEGTLRTLVIGQGVLMLVGLGLLVLGARWLVEGAVAIARAVGVSELVIGLTIVAAGTSLPEVATSIIASVRGERDIAVGNVVGSNLFNILSVLGVTAVIAPSGVRVAPAILSFDLPVMIAVSVACLPIFFTGNMIARWEGALFFGYYLAYTGYVILAATQHDVLPVFSCIMMAFVIPLTVVTLTIVTVRYARAAHRRTV